MAVVEPTGVIWPMPDGLIDQFTAVAAIPEKTAENVCCWLAPSDADTGQTAKS
jgi:hypothetical protein